MKAETIEKAIRDLVSVYGDGVRVAREGTQTFIKLAEVEMPPGCRPLTTPMLLVLDPAMAKPVPYVKPGQLLSNGRSPNSTSVQPVGGESWLQYSFNVSWSEEAGIIRFIAAARQRFAQDV